jgi:alkylation response protein AidB-like acyl-CoA dehydrogenase
MDFTLTPEIEEYRRELKQLIATYMTPEVIEEQHRSGTFNNDELNRALARGGYLERAVPGLGKGDPVELWMLFNELEKAGAPFDGISITMMIAGVVSAVGTDWQKETILPSLLSGEELVCMGYSEPDYGSDVASIVTRAERDGEEWVINGAKMWTTMAHKAKWLILLTRTDTEAPKHKGLTMFIFPMDTPGITVEPVPTMGTERTNATFYDNVRISDQWRLGDVNGGWKTMGVALSFERGVMGGTSQSVHLLRHFRHWAEAEGMMEDPLVRERMVRVAIDGEVARLLTQRSAWTAATGGQAGLEGSMTKVFATEAYQKASRWLQQMAGAEGLLQFEEPGLAAEGWVEYHARHSPVTTIYGGTSEINRNNIAERHLGLPKARR